MHSTADTLASRFCKVFLLTPEAVVPASVPKWLRKQADRLQSEPMLERVEELVRLLAEQTWVEELVDGRRRTAGSDATRTATAIDRMRRESAAGRPLKVSDVRLELWKAVPEELHRDATSEKLMLSVTRKVAASDAPAA